MAEPRRRRKAARPIFASIEEAIEEIRVGNMIIIVDDEDRENEEIGRASCRERV